MGTRVVVGGGGGVVVDINVYTRKRDFLIEMCESKR
jgi:hypothetical protein